MDPEKTANTSPVRKSLYSNKGSASLAGSVEGRSLTWKDLHLTVEVKGEERKLLKQLHGHVEPGSMTALMGVSGAGKVSI